VLPDPTKPEGTDLLPAVEHIVVLMMENHSFDSYFGTLGRGDGFTLGAGGLPTNSCPDAAGDPVTAFANGSTDQTGFQVRLGWNNVFRQANSGAMDGFVVHSGHESMAYFTDEEIPFYHALAREFPVCDRWFCSVPAATYPNRRFMSAGTAAGLHNTDVAEVLANPTAPNGTIFERLDAFGIPWSNFSAGLPEVALWPSYYFGNEDKVRPIEEFYERCRAGTLPGLSLVTPALGGDEHPPQDVAVGEQFSAGVIGEVLDGPGWESTVLVFTYDEHGGFYDHVAPPPAVPPGDGIPPLLPDPDPGAEEYDRYGMRVPAVVVSPFARAGYVSSVVHDHTSILRLVETKWNIGSITGRDANASNLLDTLDLTSPPADPPELAPPAAGPPDITGMIEAGPTAVPGVEGLVPHAGPAEAIGATPGLTG
jgi:phospholipase C